MWWGSMARWRKLNKVIEHSHTTPLHILSVIVIEGRHERRKEF